MSETSIARVEIHASQETTFAGLNDRLLTPVAALTVFTVVYIPSIILPIFLAVLTIEVVMKLIMRSNWRDFFKIMRALLFEKPRKPVKN